MIQYLQNNKGEIEMTRKRFVKLLMSRGFTRNAATFRARFYIPSMYSSYLECYRVMAGLD